jgi:ATP-dependent DNA helicase RecG
MYPLSKTPDTDEYYQRLIQQGESAWVEFKTRFQKELIETLVAFANSKGGLVLVRVSDAGQIMSVDIKAETLQG